MNKIPEEKISEIKKKYKVSAIDTYHGAFVFCEGRKKVWRYLETEEEMTWRDKHMPCSNCGRTPSEDRHDGCIANLPGVNYACCGHGIKGLGYLYMSNGTLIYERDTPELFFATIKMLKEKRDKLQQTSISIV
jgi:hypothetical protein